MDWFLDRNDVRGSSALRREIGAYLRRHARDEASVDDAELVVEELLGNAVLHGEGPVWVSLEWSGHHPRLSIHDLGPDFALTDQLPADELSERGRGLYLAARLTRELTRAHRRAGGNRVTAVLDVPRRIEDSHAPPRRTVGALPAVSEASPEGAFGKESFLRALVVQLAQALEVAHGPQAAQAAVAQVGIDVGGQAEEAYRRAERAVGRLTPGQMADCFVRLKHAIDGRFFVIEASDERIVLGNDACPFGDAVRRSPALCRMTSSVFGGIAARNTDGGATVALEERIALGDPGCRVVVTLGPAGEDAVGHVYPAPRDAVAS